MTGDFYDFKEAHSDEGGGLWVTWDFAAPTDAAVVAVSSHGDGDVKGEFDRRARQMGLLPPYYEIGATVDVIDPRVLPRNPWGTGLEFGERPRGCDLKAPGHTHAWRQFYALAEPIPWWNFWQSPQPAKHTRQWLDCCGVTWHFPQDGDCETRLVIKVAGWRVTGEDTRSLARYQAIADQLAAQLTQWFQSLPPPARLPAP